MRTNVTWFWDFIKIFQKFSMIFSFLFKVHLMKSWWKFDLKNQKFLSMLFENFEFLERDEGVFNPKVKKESKNTLIQTTTSRGKNAKFFDAFSRRAEWQCGTRPNRGGIFRALNSRKVEGLRVTPPNLSRIGVDLGVQCGTMFWHQLLLCCFTTKL